MKMLLSDKCSTAFRNLDLKLLLVAGKRSGTESFYLIRSEHSRVLSDEFRMRLSCFQMICAHMDFSLQTACNHRPSRTSNSHDPTAPATIIFCAGNIFGPAFSVSPDWAWLKSKVRTGKKTFLLLFLLSKNELVEPLRFLRFFWRFIEVERVKGIEPSFQFRPNNIKNSLVLALCERL